MSGPVAHAGYLGGFFLCYFGVFRAFGNRHPAGPCGRVALAALDRWEFGRRSFCSEITLDRSVTPLGQCDLVRITPSSSSLQKLSSERPSSDGEGVMENGVAVCNGKEQGESCPKQKPESETLRPVLWTLAAGMSPWRFCHAPVTVLVALTDPRRPSGEQEPSEALVPAAGPGFLWPDGPRREFKSVAQQAFPHVVCPRK